MKYEKCIKCGKKGVSLKTMFSFQVGRGKIWKECKYCKWQEEEK